MCTNFHKEEKLQESAEQCAPSYFMDGMFVGHRWVESRVDSRIISASLIDTRPRRPSTNICDARRS